MTYSVLYSEEIPHITSEIIAEAESDVDPGIVRALGFQLESSQAVCRAWGFREADDRDQEPVISDIPTLILAGEWDPSTPPSYGRLARRSSSFRKSGHA